MSGVATEHKANDAKDNAGEKGVAMVRMVIEHKVKDVALVEKFIDVIRQVRNEAMKQKGFITGETLVNVDDPTNVLVLSTWESVDDWNGWDTADIRLKLKPKINELLSEPYTVRKFHYYLVQQKRVRTIF